MSTTVRKHPSSGNYHIPSPGQEMTCRDVYVVTWEGEPAAAPADGVIMADAISEGLPYIGKRNTLCDPNIGMMVCKSLDWQKLPGSSTAWNVTVTWGTYANWLSPDGTEGEDTEPFTRVTRSASMRMMQVYRTGVTPPAPASYVWPPSVDIGGTRVDINGQPSVLGIPQMAFTVEWMYDRSSQEGSGGAPAPEPPAELVDWIGIRNQSPFLGYPAGSVVVVGANASPLDDQWYMMHFSFLFDWWHHHEQRSAPNVGGLNWLQTQASTFIGASFKQATKVGWWQPYPDILDINDMFPPDVLSAITSLEPTAAFGAGCAAPIRDTTGMQFDFPSFP